MITGRMTSRLPVRTKSDPVINAGLTMLQAAQYASSFPWGIAPCTSSAEIRELPAGAPDMAQPKKSASGEPEDAIIPLSFIRDTHTKNGNTDGMTQQSHISKPEIAAFKTTSPNTTTPAQRRTAAAAYSLTENAFMGQFIRMPPEKDAISKIMVDKQFTLS